MKCALWAPAYLLVCRSVLARDGVEWTYSAPDGCPSEQQFRDQVESRLLASSQPSSSPAASADVPETRPRVTVEVRLEPAERRAFLYFREGDAPSVERTVYGDTCTELVEGIALITALAFGAERPSAEPSATPLAPTANAATAEAPPQSPGVEKRTPIPSKSRSTRLTEREAPVLEQKSLESERRARHGAESSPPSLELGAGVFLNSWIAPEGGRGADGFLRLAPQGDGWSARVFGFYGLGTANVSGRRADFTLWGGRIEGCPISKTLFPSLLGEACLALEAGSLRGRGDARSLLLEGESRRVFWAAASVTARVRAMLGRWVSLEAEGDLTLPMVHHEFVFDEQVPVFQTPWVGYGARLGAALHFL